MHLADALSRNYLEDTGNTTEIEEDIASINQLEYSAASNGLLQAIKYETDKDQSLQKLK